MADVLQRTTLEQRFSVNTPDYPIAIWIINPDLSGVVYVPKKYWKTTGDVVSEMNQTEKDAIDASLIQPETIATNQHMAELTTTSGTLVEVYSYEPYLDDVVYIVQFFAEITNSARNKKISWEFLINDTTVIGEGKYSPGKNNDYTPISVGFVYVNPIVDNVKFSFKMLSTRPTGTAKVRRILVTLRREGT